MARMVHGQWTEAPCKTASIDHMRDGSGNTVCGLPLKNGLSAWNVAHMVTCKNCLAKMSKVA